MNGPGHTDRARRSRVEAEADAGSSQPEDRRNPALSRQFRRAGFSRGVRAVAGRWIAVAGAALAIAACAAPQEPALDTGALPARVVLHYEFAGDWAATAGDACEERLGLSQGVFLTLASADGGDSAFHVARFFMLEEASRADALVGVADHAGVLQLTVETDGVIDGRAADIAYDLRLEPHDPHHVRLTGFIMTVRDRAGETVRADLLAEAASDRTIPVLSVAGPSGLCLKRL
jgi:hypothetical protein